MKKITDADKARLKKLTAGKGALANGKLSMDEQLEFNALKRKERQATAYSPAPMSAAAKKKAGARGKATAAKTTARGPKAGSSTVSKIVKRVKTVAREVRDVPTAAANVYKSRSMPQGGVAKFAKKDLKTQIKEVGTAIKSGKKGTEAAQETTKSMKGRVGGGGLDYYISKPKKKRK